MADVTERLTNVLEDLEELSESDVSAVAQVVDHIVAVRRPPTEVSVPFIMFVETIFIETQTILDDILGTSSHFWKSRKVQENER